MHQNSGTAKVAPLFMFMTKNADVKTIFASNPEAMTQIESGDSYTGCVVGGGSEAPEYVVVLWNL